MEAGGYAGDPPHAADADGQDQRHECGGGHQESPGSRLHPAAGPAQDEQFHYGFQQKHLQKDCGGR